MQRPQLEHIIRAASGITLRNKLADSKIIEGRVRQSSLSGERLELAIAWLARLQEA